MRNSPRVGQWATMYTLTKTGWASLDAHPVQPRRSATSFRLLLLLATNHRHEAEQARAQKRERARLRRRDAVPVNENAVRTSVALDRQVEDVVSARVQTVSSSQIEDLCPVATIWSGWRRIDRDRMPVERSADPVIVEGKHVEADRHCVRGHRESRLEDVLVVRIFVGSAIPYRCRRIDADVLRAVARRNSLPAAWRCRYNCGRFNTAGPIGQLGWPDRFVTLEHATFQLRSVPVPDTFVPVGLNPCAPAVAEASVIAAPAKVANRREIFIQYPPKKS